MTEFESSGLPIAAVPTADPVLRESPLAATDLPTSSRVGKSNRWLVRKLLQAVGNPSLTIRLWNGEEIGSASNEPVVARVFVANPSTLVKLLVKPKMTFGEAYCNGQITVDGDLVECVESVFRALHNSDRSFLSGRLWNRLTGRRRNTRVRSRENIHHHYDIGNDFYRLWLDERMLYTCAYFSNPDMSLADAQVSKMNHVCRKVRLKPGDTVVEAGCGWGALALHMARHYGVSVRACNISHEQIVYARERAEVEGLSDRVEFIEDDWRNLSGQYDAFLSVGMLEHIGSENYSELGSVIRKCLKPSGLGVIHTIGRNRHWPLDPWIQKHIFPGAHPPSLREVMDVFEDAQFSVLDVENIRLHYVKTLEYWLERYERHTDAVSRIFDDEFVKVWRLYLCGSLAAFRTGGMQLFQIVFSDYQNNVIPLTRTHMTAADNDAVAGRVTESP